MSTDCYIDILYPDDLKKTMAYPDRTIRYGHAAVVGPFYGQFDLRDALKHLALVKPVITPSVITTIFHLFEMAEAGLKPENCDGIKIILRERKEEPNYQYGSDFDDIVSPSVVVDWLQKHIGQKWRERTD